MASVLLVDDASFARHELKKILSELKLDTIVEAQNGFEAIKKYKEINPDLIILDITMPDMNGICALREIRKLDAGVKAIICSAMGQEIFIMEAIEEGAMDFIVKPYDPERIKVSVEKALASA